ncbi:LPXTG cell wall anchor domain-containing protein [Microbacterium sp.]|uniref:LPXTG cell wall anchor domain-containing protein n=1 Tax=Microbacterium sp. TaxID=51671 RepID=UPI0039E2FC4A
MTGTRILTLGLLILVAGGVAALVQPAPALAQSVPLTHDFGILLPGETVSHELTFHVDNRATVFDATFLLDGDGAWSATVCSAKGLCRDLSGLKGRTLDSGDYRLVLGLTLSESASTTDISADGVIRLVEADVDSSVSEPGATGGVDPVAPALPATGAQLPLLLILIGSGLLMAGGIVLASTRRHARPADAREDLS